MELTEIEDRLYQLTGVKNSEPSRKFISDFWNAAAKFLLGDRSCGNCSNVNSAICWSCMRKDQTKTDCWSSIEPQVPQKLSSINVKVTYQTVRVYISMSELKNCLLYVSKINHKLSDREFRNQSGYFVEELSDKRLLELTSIGAAYFQDIGAYMIFETTKEI